MKTICITKSGSYHEAREEDVTIIIQPQSLDGYGPKGLGELFERQGKEVAAILFNTLPGGTVEAIKSELDRLFRELNATP